MNIAFILPSADLCGGVYVVIEHATRINRLDGNKVFILTESNVPASKYAWHEAASGLAWLSIKEGAEINFDYVIASFWRTVYYLHKLKSRNYVYFVQSIESKFYDDESQYFKEWVDTTYAMCLPTITEATWIKKYLDINYGNEVYLVKNGIRKDLYSLNGDVISPRNAKKLRVLVEGPINIGFKNVRKTLELCRTSEADELWLLTSTKTDDTSLADKVFSSIPIDEVSKIYRSCDVIVKLSYIEGMFGPPLEMFHCGGTAIVYDVTGHDEYIENDYNAIVIKTGDESGVVKAINKLKRDSIYLNQLQQNAIITAGEWKDWDYATMRFYETLKSMTNSYDYYMLKALSNQVDRWVGLAKEKANLKHLVYNAFKKIIIKISRN